MVENSWITVLMITVLGMGLLFLALAFFYGLLGAMARLLKDRAPAPVERVAPQPAPSGEEVARLRAAAVAVALARTGLGRPQARHTGAAMEGKATPSPWWSLHHQRRLARQSRQGRGR